MMMKAEHIVVTTAVLLFFANYFTAAQQKPDKPPVVLEHAKILKNKVIGGESVKELIDSVRITRGDMIVDCNYAVHFQDMGRILFEKDVHYSDSLRDMRADRVTYFVDEDSLTAEGSVLITQELYEGRCNLAYYSNDRENIYMRQKVKLIKAADGITLTGRQGFGDKTMEYAWVAGDAHLVKKDSLDETEITIDAEKIEYFNAEAMALATDSVEVLKDDVKANSDTLEYYSDEKYALMYSDPVVFRTLDEMRGDSIYLYFVEESIDRIELFGHASALSAPEYGTGGEFNKMYGKSIVIRMMEDKVGSIVVVGNASSLYYLYEDQEPKGINKATGDKIYLDFSEGKLETIMVIGGSEGTYYPAEYPGIIE